MAERAFVVMQVGAKDSPERRRADEIYKYIIAPAVSDAGLEPYRADLDFSPGAITPKILSELLNAGVVIADLTGRNPNVFYELGITHSFARPLISIADSSGSLPFDAKDERVIELGEYPPSGLPYAQGEEAKAALKESLKIVLANDYSPPSPLREVGANRSVDQLAPEDPLAAEMAQIRETLADIHKRLPRRTVAVSRSTMEDISTLRAVIERNMGYLDESDFNMLTTNSTSQDHDSWVADLEAEWQASQSNKGQTRDRESADPWAEAEAAAGGFSDEPPF
jgi:hypothetical protein